MKTTLLTLLALTFTIFSFGQAPEAFKYQAVVRDAGGAILSNQAVGYQLTILQGSPTGVTVYSESFTPTTNDYGLVNIGIGTGTTSYNFSTIDWANGPYYMQTAVDVNGGTSYTVMGTSQLLSVPYALYAKTAGNGAGNSYLAGAGINITGNTISNSAPDQTVTINGTGSTNVSGTYPNFTINSVDNVNDADSDPTNEIQTISQSGYDITLSNGGGTFSVSDGDTTLWKENGNNIYRLSGNVGIGDLTPEAKLDILDTLSGTNADNSVEVLSINTGMTDTIYSASLSEIRGTNGANRGASGQSRGVSNAWNQGIYGYADSSNVGNVAVLGNANGIGAGIQNIGVYGVSADALGEYNYGGYFAADGAGNGAGNNTGIYAFASGNSNANYGIYAQSLGIGPNDYAGYFDGNVQIAGNLDVIGTISKGAGTFKIDHPLDPENKNLVHSFVESPEMLNIYSGNVTTDDDGVALVYLPNYFEVANKDFRYQLTVIGSFAQAIILEEISNNMFKIKTSEPNIKVSWQVTSVRADKFAEENRIIPEQDKSVPGKYLHPELYGAEEIKKENQYYRSNGDKKKIILKPSQAK